MKSAAEKAKELVDRYKRHAYSGGNNDFISGEQSELHHAKQCALICVDEILKYLHSIDEDSDLMFAKEINELESVKQEIELL